MIRSVPRPELTVVCWVGSRPSDLAEVHRAYAGVLSQEGVDAEFLYVLDGRRRRSEERLLGLDDPRSPVRVLRMAKGFGESAGLQHAFGEARGRWILTVPDRFQADPSTVPALLQRLRDGADVAVACRERGQDAVVNRVQYRLFHDLVHRLAARDLHDVTSGLRALTADAARKLDLYGDLHRFLPVLAARRGFRVEEVPASQHPADRSARVYGPGIYARRLLDLLNVFFLTRFTRKPLRFFGLLGLVLGAAGVAIGAWTVIEKFGFGKGLADRPLLLLGVLLAVVGVQLISLGLVGEIVLFLSPRRDAPEVTELTVPGRRDQGRGVAQR